MSDLTDAISSLRSTMLDYERHIENQIASLVELSESVEEFRVTLEDLKEVTEGLNV